MKAKTDKTLVSKISVVLKQKPYYAKEEQKIELTINEDEGDYPFMSIKTERWDMHEKSFDDFTDKVYEALRIVFDEIEKVIN